MDLHVDLEGELRQLVREEVRAALAAVEPAPAGFLNVKSAAAYLDTTEDAVRAAVKRHQLPAHRTPTGRVLFLASELSSHVLAGDGA